jgi:DNA repair photolyase
VLAEFRNPVVIVTKNQLVTRDLDLLGELARHQAVSVYISLTTLDPKLRSVMEPRTSPPAARLATIKKLAQAGIPVGALLAPVIPGLNDHEIPRLVAAAAEAGAQQGGYVILRLPYAVAPLFEQWLERHYPDRKEKVLSRLRAMRGGKLYDAEFGKRMSGEGIFADQIEKLFEVASRRAGWTGRRVQLSTDSFRRPGGNQLEFFLKERAVEGKS